MNDSSLDLQDYLDATSDSSKRTRTVLIVLVVACALAFVGFLNSLRAGWMLSRIHNISNPSSPYVMEKLGFTLNDVNDHRYNEFYTAVVRSYVENAFTIRVPFFGFSFDVNDLGLLGGLGFIIILVQLRFSLRSEIVSLRMSFKAVMTEAKTNPRLLTRFYELLAMRQLLSMPYLEDPERKWRAHRSRILQIVSKSLCFAPVLIYTLVGAHDFLTIDIGDVLNHFRTQFLVTYTITFWLAILALAVWCYIKWRQIDKLWEGYWTEVQSLSGTQ